MPAIHLKGTVWGEWIRRIINPRKSGAIGGSAQTGGLQNEVSL